MFRREDESSFRLTSVARSLLQAATLQKPRRRSSARRNFFQPLRHAPILWQKSRHAVAFPGSHAACARPLQSRYHRRQWFARADLYKTQIAIDADDGSLCLGGRARGEIRVVVMKAGQRRKAEKGERKGMGEGCNLRAKPNGANPCQRA